VTRYWLARAALGDAHEQRVLQRAGPGRPVETRVWAPLEAEASQGDLTAHLGGGCGNAVLVITDTNPMPAPRIVGVPGWTHQFTWSMTFKPLGAQLSSGQLSVGVHRSGALGYLGTDVQNAGMYQLSVSDGWGIADGDKHGGVDAYSYNADLVGDMEQSSFTSGDNWAESIMAMGDLEVTHRFQPSADPNLYAVDVTVARHPRRGM
jgi:hypothetical protein